VKPAIWPLVRLPGARGNGPGHRVNAWASRTRGAVRLPHLGKHDVAEIDAEIRAALTETGTG
jgi:hypothetical protein